MTATRKYDLDVHAHRERLLPLLRHILAQPRRLTPREHQRLMRKHPKPDGGGFYSLANLVDAWRAFAGTDGLPRYDEAQLYKLRRKPVRSLSGVTPLTVLTKPFPCPGECIFCPNDVRMPKSYLADEPGAQRAEKKRIRPLLAGPGCACRPIAIWGTARTKSRSSFWAAPGPSIRRLIRFGLSKRIFDALHDFGAGIDGREQVNRRAAREIASFMARRSAMWRCTARR